MGRPKGSKNRPKSKDDVAEAVASILNEPTPEVVEKKKKPLYAANSNSNKLKCAECEEIISVGETCKCKKKAVSMEDGPICKIIKAADFSKVMLFNNLTHEWFTPVSFR